MTDLVSKALSLAAAKESALPSAQVERALESELDLGNLLTWHENEVELEKITAKDDDQREKFLIEMARDNAQILFNAIWELPTERVEEAIVAVLPPPTFNLPREKPVPKAKPLTKWEQYAKEKGIDKKKAKSRMVWDDVVKNWVPRFGYKKVKAEEEKNWMMHYKESGPNAMVDPFEKATEEKRERVAKNELQRLRNIAKAKKVTLPGVGLTPLVSKGGGAVVSASQDLQKAADLAKKSTASLGKFQEKLPTALEKKASKPQGAKRKFEPLVGDSSLEKTKNLEILEKLTSKKSKLDIGKAVGQKIQRDEREREEEKNENAGSGGRKGGRSRKSLGTKSKSASKKGGVKRNRKPPPGKKGKGRK